jgi:RNA polymerase sigma-70 factor (ECF subfamily)
MVAHEKELDLIRRARHGDADAFGALYQRHLDAIYRYIYFRIGDARDAEDLTEHVFLRAWQALPNYKDLGTPFINWLYRIAHNTLVDDYRRHPPRAELPAESLNLVSPQPAALEQVIEAETAAQLATAIAQLPDDKQRVLVLRFVEGLSHAEVAKILDISEGASRTLQHRSLADLARVLDAAQGGDHV